MEINGITYTLSGINFQFATLVGDWVSFNFSLSTGINYAFVLQGQEASDLYKDGLTDENIYKQLQKNLGG